MAMATLPLLRTGAMQLFHAESSDRYDKPLPRVTQLTATVRLSGLRDRVLARRNDRLRCDCACNGHDLDRGLLDP
jgi:hypothetical protein